MKFRDINIICRKPHQRERLERIAHALGYRVCDRGQITVIVEDHPGSALLYLKRTTVETAVVITENPCSAYWLDVMETQPIMGFVALGTEDDIAKTLRSAQNDSPIRMHSPIRLKLTRLERRILRQLAFGFGNTEIADILENKTQVINNYVSTILSKVRATHPNLTIRNRVHLAFFYWGDWLILEQSPQPLVNNNP